VNSPRVSIGIPAYNNAGAIRATIESALAQTYPDLEVLVADHGSTDATAAIIEGFRDRARLRILDPTPRGGGALRNWNRVSQEARGTYFKLLCGDDLLDPDAVAGQVAALDAHPTAVMVASRRRIVDAHGVEFLAARGLGSMDGLVPGLEAIRRTVRAGTNLFGEPAFVLMRRDVLADSGYWDATDPYLIDQATYVRLLHRGDLVASRPVIGSFRLNAGQLSFQLLADQGSQAIAFHDRERAAHPNRIGPLDVVVGNLNVRKTALLRRLSYLALGAQRLTLSRGPGERGPVTAAPPPDDRQGEAGRGGR
jgi:glycosyltransferase involved in cell wall biosynthesis